MNNKDKSQTHSITCKKHSSYRYRNTNKSCIPGLKTCYTGKGVHLDLMLAFKTIGFEVVDFPILSPSQALYLFTCFVALQFLMTICFLKGRKFPKQLTGDMEYHCPDDEQEGREKCLHTHRMETQRSGAPLSNFILLKRMIFKLRNVQSNKKGSMGLFEISSRLYFRINCMYMKKMPYGSRCLGHRLIIRI